MTALKTLAHNLLLVAFAYGPRSRIGLAWVGENLRLGQLVFVRKARYHPISAPTCLRSCQRLSSRNEFAELVVVWIAIIHGSFDFEW